jgi:hypothetical protein
MADEKDPSRPDFRNRPDARKTDGSPSGEEPDRPDGADGTDEAVARETGERDARSEPPPDPMRRLAEIYGEEGAETVKAGFENLISTMNRNLDGCDKPPVEVSPEGKRLNRQMEDGDPLPEGFDQWELVTSTYGETIAHVAARFGTLPEGFDRWEIADSYGWTVAHEWAFTSEELPGNFTRWDLANENGWTVAHVAAEFHCLPEGFDRWDLEDNDGRTVGDVAICYGSLPEGFDWWDICNGIGKTLYHSAAGYGRLPSGFDRWDIADFNGRTVAHEAAERNRLPEGFDHWEWADKDGWTVAHSAAKGGCLPTGFAHMDWADAKGRTVEQVVRETDAENGRVDGLLNAESATPNIFDAILKIHEEAEKAGRAANPPGKTDVDPPGKTDVGPARPSSPVQVRSAGPDAGDGPRRKKRRRMGKGMHRKG